MDIDNKKNAIKTRSKLLRDVSKVIPILNEIGESDFNNMFKRLNSITHKMFEEQFPIRTIDEWEVDEIKEFVLNHIEETTNERKELAKKLFNSFIDYKTKKNEVSTEIKKEIEEFFYSLEIHEVRKELRKEKKL